MPYIIPKLTAFAFLLNSLSTSFNFTLKISDSIEGAIKSNAKSVDTITLVTGSLYLIGEVLNLN